MLFRVLCLAAFGAALGCAGKTPAAREPQAPVTTTACSETCEQQLHACVGNTVERDRYSSCMPEHDECVMACFTIL